ncbi:MAG: cell division protein ZapA [Chitinophagia bacterium]|nr:cell division protein ZapA [Chitinophagia bacterium]
MSDDELIPINLWLAGRSYRIRIKPDEESIVRRAAKLADDRITELRNQYAGKDEQDFIAMCLLSYATDTSIEAFGHPLVISELGKMGDKIDKALAKSEANNG